MSGRKAVNDKIDTRKDPVPVRKRYTSMIHCC
jgi:hypothetical protein